MQGKPLALKGQNLTIALEFRHSSNGAIWQGGSLANLTVLVVSENGTGVVANETASSQTPFQCGVNSPIVMCNLTGSELNGTITTVRGTADGAEAGALTIYPSNAGTDMLVTPANGSIGNATFATPAINLTLPAAANQTLASVVEGSTTLSQALRLCLSALVGKVAGANTTTITMRDLADSKDRITATVDSNGNRTAMTLDAT